MTSERRQHKRKAWTHAIVFRICEGESAEEEKMTLRGETSDISASGLRISSTRPLSPGNRIYFGESKLEGVVKWSGREGSAYSAGIQLV
jgi:hypothetical protein